MMVAGDVSMNFRNFAWLRWGTSKGKRRGVWVCLTIALLATLLMVYQQDRRSLVFVQLLRTWQDNPGTDDHRIAAMEAHMLKIGKEYDLATWTNLARDADVWWESLWMVRVLGFVNGVATATYSDGESVGAARYTAKCVAIGELAKLNTKEAYCGIAELYAEGLFDGGFAEGLVDLLTYNKALALQAIDELRATTTDPKKAVNLNHLRTTVAELEPGDVFGN